YAGRWPHIHFEVFPDAESLVDAGSAILTSQIALPAAEAGEVYARDGYAGSAETLGPTTLESANGLSGGWDRQRAPSEATREHGHRLSMNVPIATTAEPEAGGMPDGGGEGGPGGEPPAGAPDGGGPGGQPPEGGEGVQPPEGGPEGGPEGEPPA